MRKYNVLSRNTASGRSGRERERERERERGRERALLGTFHNGGSRASPAHGLGINILTGLLDSLASIWPRLSPDSGEWLAGWREREREREREPLGLFATARRH